MFKKFLVFLLVLAMTAVYPTLALADSQLSENDEIENDGDAMGIGASKEWKEKRTEMMTERRMVQSQFGDKGLEIEELEKQLEEAEEKGDSQLAELLKEQIEELKLEMKTLKDEVMLKIEAMKAFMKERYTEEELTDLDNVGHALKEKVEAVLPVENVITDKDVKFDTPPVIKHGRTLIPLRAVAEGMKADVSYDAEKHEVTIVKNADTEEEIKIVMDLEKGTVKVNNEPVEIDVPAEVMNNRTMVPLRFIAEQLNLKVQWDQGTQTVALEE